MLDRHRELIANCEPQTVADVGPLGGPRLSAPKSCQRHVADSPYRPVAGPICRVARTSIHSDRDTTIRLAQTALQFSP